jgi:quercetin dioxygenase-like cupin family protein
MSESSRLRVPPRERFAGDEHFFDLAEAFARLPRESTGEHGVIGKALYKHGACTTAIFAFEQGASMRRHEVEGEAILQVLTGRLHVGTDGEGGERRGHELAPDQVLLLAPGVKHDIRALEPTRALMHVILNERPDAD